jgi:hypothetical protein
MIPEDPTSIGPYLYYLIDNYGMLSLAQIRAFEETYLDRAKQDN